ncbi:hypothetical protein KSF_086550 [Reticulibacter mediterranei]|uniref:Uncharacterized protein n=1 Tax=Reticulibacter mediterranei TaxID=2778369 RepID=A0A8J3IXI3_9CHLR|nr:hypothetical protein KSF_086550 [Reticulibacter mediterranei]
MLVFLGTGDVAVQFFLAPLIETDAIVAQNQAEEAHRMCRRSEERENCRYIEMVF